jgi:AcrR family transcriptional regulator
LVSELRHLERVDSPSAAPLPRGRHNLPPEVVRASQRERLLRAMLDCVAERGYQATTVPQVVAAARVSRNAFYELFEDKLDCFLVLCDELTEELLRETFPATAVGGWSDALRQGTRRYLAWWQARPRFARAYLVELPTAGTRALSQRARAYARFEERFAWLAALARRQQPELAPMRPVAPRLIVLAVTELVAQEVAAGRFGDLVALEDDIVWLTTRMIVERASGA